jgi:hypothetical protein
MGFVCSGDDVIYETSRRDIVREIERRGLRRWWLLLHQQCVTDFTTPALYIVS